MITLSLIEDAPDYREALMEILTSAREFVLLDACATAEEALVTFVARPPQIAIVDLHLPGLDGVACMRKLRPKLPNTLFLVLTSSDAQGELYAALQAGAVGYLLKSALAPEILAAVREVHAGGSPMSPVIARRVVKHFERVPKAAAPELERLSPRENEVLQALARGLRYKEIADLFAIGEETVRTHLRRLYQKLEVSSRTEAVVKLKGW